MARLNDYITREEEQVYQAWCLKKGIPSEDPQNAELVARYFMQTWNEDVTEKNLELAFPQLQPHLKFWTPVEAEHERLIQRLGTEATATIEGFIDKRRFVRDGQERLETFNCLANYMLQTGHQISTLNLDNAIGNIQMSPHGRFGYLRFAPTPDQLRRQKELEAKANTPVTKVEKDPNVAMPEASDYRGVVRPLSGHLKQWKENQDRPSPVTQNDPTPTSDSPAYWQRQVRDFLASIRENSIRTKLEPEFAAPKNGNWEITFRILQNTYNRIKTEGIVRSRTI